MPREEVGPLIFQSHLFWNRIIPEVGTEPPGIWAAQLSVGVGGRMVFI
jgi:hypothetical protein